VIKLVPQDWSPSADDTAFDRLGGLEAVAALVERFYDFMSEREPELTALHSCDQRGAVSRGTRDRFALFLAGWLGGPQEYLAKHGHPRLRMRHAPFSVDARMRDAWLRSMSAALDAQGVVGGLRTFLDARFAQVADFLRNQPD
jgi:hemoglobin